MALPTQAPKIDGTTSITPFAIPPLVEKLAAEGLIGMCSAAAVYGRGRDNTPTHPSTPARHALKGFRRRDGTVLFLEAIRVAGRLMTSRPAVLRFFAAQNDPSGTVAVAPPTESPGKLLRRRVAASEKLDELLGTKTRHSRKRD